MRVIRALGETVSDLTSEVRLWVIGSCGIREVPQRSDLAEDELLCLPGGWPAMEGRGLSTGSNGRGPCPYLTSPAVLPFALA